MISFMKPLLIGSCTVCLAIAGCAADGLVDTSTAVTAPRPSETLFSPPPMPMQAPVEQVVEKTAAQKPRQTAATASFQFSDTSTVTPDVQSVAMQSTPAAPIRLTLSPTAKKPARTLVTLGPNDDLAAMVRAAPGVVLVDFYADWCGPCRTQGKILREMQATAAGHNALIVKVNVDQHEAIASVLQVSALPTLVLVKNGKIVERKTGLADQQEIGLLLAR